ncbi:MAG: histidine kinase [Anaerolineaceae bacterium]|nr:histidine kinase [Anaerolineaceae bacterium]
MTQPPADPSQPRFSRRLWQGVTLQLFVLVVLPLTILLLAVTFGSVGLHNQAMRSLVGDRDLHTVRAAASSLDQSFFHQEASIEMLAEASRSGETFTDVVHSNQVAVSSFDRGVALFASDGSLLASNQNVSGWVDRESAATLASWVSFLQKSKTGAQFSPVFPDDKRHAFISFIAAPTPQGDLMVGAFSPDVIVQLTLKDMIGASQIAAWVITPQDQVIYQIGSLVPQENPAAHPGSESALRGESGINYYPTSQGEHVVAFSPIQRVGWGLVLEEPWESIAGPLLQTTQLAPLVLVPVVLLMIIALWFGLHQIVQPLKALESRAGELAQGDFGSIRKPVGGVPEIQNLQSRLAEMAERLQEAQDSLHSYIGAITAGVENERRSLARELHDDTLQALIAINQRIQLANLKTGKLQEQTSLEGVEKLVQQTMVNLRRMVRGLRPIYLEDLGLVASLNMLASEVQQNHGLTVQMTTSGTECRLAPDVEMALYRMAQEALSNIVRHARASQAWLVVEFGQDRLQMTVRDDGNGFVLPLTPDGYARQGHYGLLGLYERAELIGAHLSIQSKPGQGTTITVRRNSIVG